MRVLLPGEGEGRRGFLRKGLVGAALLAAGGGAAWLATRRTRPSPQPGPLAVFDAVQAAVILAVAERLIPPYSGFPRPAEIGIAARVDAIAAMAHPATQKELRQLVSLFESALGGLLDGSPRLFTECDAARQDRRLRAWMTSRIALRRTGFYALRRLVTSAYYSSPATWGAVGYPGPPVGFEARRAGPPSAPGEAAPSPPPPPRRVRPAPVRASPVEPAPVEPVPVPGVNRGG